MKSLWIIISTLAIANLLALIGFGAWLHTSDRLDGERLERVRRIFADTRTVERTRQEEEERKQEEARQAAAEQARADLPPLTADQRLAQARDQADVAALRLGRVHREVEDLRAVLLKERASLDADTEALAKERAEFEAMRARIMDMEGDEQFKKSLSLYESLPAEKAREMLLALVEQGEVEQVVAYLNSMQTRTAKKIVEGIEDPKLAADLLERLRTRGLEARASGTDP